MSFVPLNAGVPIDALSIGATLLLPAVSTGNVPQVRRQHSLAAVQTAEGRCSRRVVQADVVTLLPLR
jgi:hypothetical protein